MSHYEDRFNELENLSKMGGGYPYIFKSKYLKREARYEEPVKAFPSNNFKSSLQMNQTNYCVPTALILTVETNPGYHCFSD